MKILRYLIICFFAFIPYVFSQEYPDKPVRLIVPAAPGGGFDFVGRILAQYMGENLKQNFIVENKVGSGTLIGTQFAAKANPDGYTVLLGGLSNIIWNMNLYTNPGYDSFNDFTPVGMAYTLPYVAVVRKDFPSNTLKEFIDLAKKNPEKYNMAHLGSGTGQQIIGLNLMKLTGIKLTEIPYKGAQTAYPDLITGRADIMFDTSPSARPHFQSGNVKVLSIISPRRTSVFSGIPTSAEAGVPGWEVESWVGLFVHAKTPPVIIEKLRKSLTEILSNKEVRQKFEQSAGEVFQLSILEIDSYMTSEQKKWGAIIRDSVNKIQ